LIARLIELADVHPALIVAASINARPELFVDVLPSDSRHVIAPAVRKRGTCTGAAARLGNEPSIRSRGKCRCRAVALGARVFASA